MPETPVETYIYSLSLKGLREFVAGLKEAQYAWNSFNSAMADTSGVRQATAELRNLGKAMRYASNAFRKGTGAAMGPGGFSSSQYETRFTTGVINPAQSLNRFHRQRRALGMEETRFTAGEGSPLQYLNLLSRSRKALGVEETGLTVRGSYPLGRVAEGGVALRGRQPNTGQVIDIPGPGTRAMSGRRLALPGPAPKGARTPFDFSSISSVGAAALAGIGALGKAAAGAAGALGAFLLVANRMNNFLAGFATTRAESSAAGVPVDYMNRMEGLATKATGVKGAGANFVSAIAQQLASVRVGGGEKLFTAAAYLNNADITGPTGLKSVEGAIEAFAKGFQKSNDSMRMNAANALGIPSALIPVLSDPAFLANLRDAEKYTLEESENAKLAAAYSSLNQSLQLLLKEAVPLIEPLANAISGLTNALGKVTGIFTGNARNAVEMSSEEYMNANPASHGLPPYRVLSTSLDQ